ncbi:MAG: TetR/AcrR family transcriptional regulator [Myxococcota bacterium]
MRKADQSARTRQALIDAATHLFGQRGYGGTSLKAVAEQAQVTHGVIPFHFGSKEGLLLAVAEELFARFHRAVMAPLQQAPGDFGSGDLERLMEAQLRFQTEHPEVGQLFLVLMFEAIGPRPELRPHFRAFQTRLQSLGMNWLRAGIEAGTLRPDLDVNATVQLMFSFFTGLRTHSLLTPDEVDSARVHRQMLAFVRRGALQMHEEEPSHGSTDETAAGA